MDDSSASHALPRSPELMRPADTALLVIDVQERLARAMDQEIMDRVVFDH